MKALYIGVDFDGTVVEHKYPDIGEPIEGALDTLVELQQAGHRLVLYTMRNDERLVQAVEYLEEEGIELYAVNDNPSQKYWAPNSRKVFCNLYIDDAALGCPLIYPDKGRPYVDWEKVRKMLVEREVL